MNLELKLLRNIPQDELIFNDSETRDILKFFFPERDSQIKTLKIDDKIREYAQGILVKAVAADYQVEIAWGIG